MSKLKPCPFCGKQPSIVSGAGGDIYVECNCGVTGALSDCDQEAIASWNRRPIEDEIARRISVVKTDCAIDGKYGVGPLQFKYILDTLDEVRE